MKNLILILLIYFPILVNADWIYVAESTGDNQGRGIGDIIYVASHFSTESSTNGEYRIFDLLTQKKKPMINSHRDKRLGLKGDIYRSAVANIKVDCEKPNEIFMVKTKYYSGNMGKNLVDTWDASLWYQIGNHSPLSLAIEMICK